MHKAKSTLQPSEKMILNEAQLEVLRQFIRQRGFKDIVVIHEILDHFACKTEEIWHTHPQLSLEEAIQKAHQTFGIMGFRPIVAAFEQQARKKYSRIFRKNLLQTLYSPRWLPLILLSGLGSYYFLRWEAIQAFSWLDNNLGSWLLFLFIVVKNLIIMRYYPGRKLRPDNILIQAAQANYFYPTLIVFSIFIQGGSASQTWAVFVAVIMAFEQAALIALMHTLGKAKEDSRIFE